MIQILRQGIEHDKRILESDKFYQISESGRDDFSYDKSIVFTEEDKTIGIIVKDNKGKTISMYISEYSDELYMMMDKELKGVI